MTKEDFYKLFTDATADEIARYSIDMISEDKEGQKLDFEFDMSGGKMALDSKSPDGMKPNTWFKFDTKTDTTLRRMLECLVDETMEIDQTMIEHFDAWRRQVCRLMTHTYKTELGEKIRQFVLGGAPKEQQSLDTIHVGIFELTDKPPVDWTITVHKKSPFDMIAEPVGDEIMQICLATGKDVNQVIEEKKAAGDKSYKYVVSATKEQYAFECEFCIFADYSINNEWMEQHKPPVS